LVDLRGVLAEKLRVREQSFDARHLGLDRMDLRLDAVQFALFLEGQLARFGGLRCGVLRSLYVLGGGEKSRALAGGLFFGALLLFQVIIVIPDAVLNATVALERQNVRADAIQKITVMADTQTTPGNAISASSNTRNVGKSRSFVGSSRMRKLPPHLRIAPAATGCVRRR
jgi:hypothetical protein